MTRKFVKFNINHFFPSRNWIIYLKCLVGGEFIKGSPQYTATNVQQIVYLLKEQEGYIKLAKEYTWIKCNSDFHGYYLTNYDNKNFEALNNLLRNDYSVRIIKIYFKMKLAQIYFKNFYSILGTLDR